MKKYPEGQINCILKDIFHPFVDMQRSEYSIIHKLLSVVQRFFFSLLLYGYVKSNIFDCSFHKRMPFVFGVKRFDVCGLSFLFFQRKLWILGVVVRVQKGIFSYIRISFRLEQSLSESVDLVFFRLQISLYSFLLNLQRNRFYLEFQAIQALT